MTNPIETDILSAIDEEYLIDLTQKLIRIQTPNPPADYGVIAPEMRRLMDEAGLETLVMEGKKGKPNVVGLWRGTDESAPTLLLDAHMDVVPAGDGWHLDPWAAEIRDGAIWGRGSADMKQSLATIITVVKALKASGFRPKGTLMCSATNDDETAGKFGLKYVIEEGLKKANWPRPDFHFLLEPSNWDVNVNFKGRIWNQVTLKGKSAHGGHPDQGVNAIEKMMTFIKRLKTKIGQGSGKAGFVNTLNVGTISGGDKVNIVPDTCSATFDYRFVDPCPAREAIQLFRSLLSELENEDPDFKTLDFEVFEERDPRKVDPAAFPVRLLRKTIKEVSGRPGSLSGTLSAGNAYWSLSQGIDATMTGPGDPAIIHTSQEHITIHDLIEGAKIVAAFTSRYVG